MGRESGGCSGRQAAAREGVFPVPTLLLARMSDTDAIGSIGIVGAGLAGAGVARSLTATDADVTILEKSRGVGGRAATRRKHGCRYDHGANYVNPSEADASRTAELLSTLGTDGLVNIDEPVWTFDRTGTVSEGDRPDADKWNWTEGMTQFAKRALAETEATIEHGVRAASIERREEAWTITDTDGEPHGPFETVVLTPPAPQTAALLAETTVDGEHTARLESATGAVQAVPYRTIRTFVLHYPFEIDRPYYGLVNVDQEHPVGWLSREECKEGHVPDGESLLIAQMSPGWSTERYDEPIDIAAPDAAEHVAELIGDDRLTDPDWVDDQGWRYALPDDAVAREPIESLEEVELYVAGDWVVGEGRAHAAFYNGVDLGERLSSSIQ